MEGLIVLKQKTHPPTNKIAGGGGSLEDFKHHNLKGSKSKYYQEGSFINTCTFTEPGTPKITPKKAKIVPGSASTMAERQKRKLESIVLKKAGADSQEIAGKHIFSFN